MARNRVGIKGSNRGRVQRRDQDSDESDEEYKVTDDEDFEESDECYSLDGDESEEILADIGKSRRVSRSRKTRRTSSGKKGNAVMKPRKRRRVSCTEDDNDDEDVADEDDNDDEFMSLDREADQVNKPMEKKMVSYTEVDDVDDSGSGGGGGDDDDDDGEEDYKELVFSGRNRKQRKKPREKKRVVYTEDDDDDDEAEVADEDDAEFMPMGRKANQIKMPTETKRVSYAAMDDDDEEEEDEDDYAEFVSSGRKRNQRKKPQEKRAACIEDDEDKDVGDDDDDDEFMYSCRKVNQKKNLNEKREVSYTEEEDHDDCDDDDEFMYSSRKVNQKKNLRKKREVSYTEDDDDDDDGGGGGDGGDDDEFMNSGRKVNQKKNHRVKREVSYTEEDEEEEEEDDDDDDDLGFMSSSRKRNQIKKRREKRIVSYKEDNQEEEEEDETDAEFKLSESDFVDDEDETPKIKKNQVISSHTQKKSVRGVRRKSKKSKTKNPKKPKQRNHRFGQRLGSSKTKSVTNKTRIENRNKISKRRKQRAMAESDSDFVNSASSDHEYTISEEEREQMREARVYCANLRDKLRSSSSGNQDKQPTYEQKKYPIRKGKEKIEDVKDDVGKQVCGVCLSEEQKRTMRGVLNCCRHYFCFSCIMEWSKVESRCPLCKQRFTTITKAAKSDTGFDLRTVVIPVPECDQVYEPSEEELRGYLDPYESVICTECQNGGDDALMLLCDICDSSAHTFCAGLGREVPEGNWYCEGCRPTVFGTLNSQRVTANSDRRLSNNASDLSSSSPIAGGFDLNELYVPETPLAQQTRVHPEPNPAPTGTVATTLRDRRRIHRQIHHRFLNNNRMNDLIGRSSGTSASTSGIRLFGSQLDQARVSVSQNDHIFSSMHDPSTFYPRSDQFSVQVQNSNLASADIKPWRGYRTLKNTARRSSYTILTADGRRLQCDCRKLADK
ncbi:hypothetical protein L1987_20081 [Smallanthus sonchifolius]|uniref:Uncharacterized protein n=1 Tax=Smallanthus sonchifolius TaxID=185202 RepID=A0ACB9IRM1_9ASTR|nr:hypothetical protein L1987_20081 [Smallanthus sonchifolius]